MRHPFIKFFHFSNLLQMPNDHRMAYVEFFGYFSCSCKRISFNDRSQLLSTSKGWLLRSSSSKLLSPLQNFLNLQCTVCSLAVPGPDVLKWSEVAQSCPTLYHPMDCSPPGSSVYGILQARLLEWVAISCSGGSSQLRDKALSLMSPALAGGFFTMNATWEAPLLSWNLPYQ